MHRFFCDSKDIFKDYIDIVSKAKLHQIKDVLRLKKKDRVEVFDEKNNEYSCRIKDITQDRVRLGIREKKTIRGRDSVTVAVACAIPKRAKFDDIVDKLTQLGVDRIIPMISERVIVNLDEDKKTARQKRWARIIESAGEQSKSKRLPVLEEVKEIKEVLDNSAGYDLKLVPALFGSRKTIKQVLSGRRPKNILALIGPEGDFTPEEVNLARNKGFIPVTLGEQVLRVDTAAIAVASFIKLLGKRGQATFL